MLYDPKWEQAADLKKKVLIDARKMISSPSDWCQHYANGTSICAVHAIQRAVRLYRPDGCRGELELEAISSLGKAMGLPKPGTGSDEGRWNDTHTHAEVLAAFDRAIAA